MLEKKHDHDHCPVVVLPENPERLHSDVFDASRSENAWEQSVALASAFLED